MNFSGFINTKKRSHYAGTLGASLTGTEVILMGWAHRRRDHGGVIFVDLRDREGIAQIVFNPDISVEAHREAHRIRSEFVLAVRGKVHKRPAGMENPEMKSGEIEVMVEELEILNEAKTPPFSLDEWADISEAGRLKYRYLALRRPVYSCLPPPPHPRSLLSSFFSSVCPPHPPHHPHSPPGGEILRADRQPEF